MPGIFLNAWHLFFFFKPGQPFGCSRVSEENHNGFISAKHRNRMNFPPKGIQANRIRLKVKLPPLSEQKVTPQP
jgi:hypothetical protein